MLKLVKYLNGQSRFALTGYLYAPALPVIPIIIYLETGSLLVQFPGVLSQIYNVRESNGLSKFGRQCMRQSIIY
jgi:hypothetical protein